MTRPEFPDARPGPAWRRTLLCRAARIFHGGVSVPRQLLTPPARSLFRPVALAILTASTLLWAAAHASQIRLAWSANPPGEEVSGYFIQHQRHGATGWTTVAAGTNTTVLLTNLTPGRYTIRAYASNAWAVGDISPAVEGLTKPGMVRDLRVLLTLDITIPAQ